jgi:30S ribosomal protein S31
LGAIKKGEISDMGKGDKRTRRGKIFAGTFGKTRPKKTKSAATSTEAKPAKKKGK